MGLRVDKSEKGVMTGRDNWHSSAAKGAEGN